MKQGVEPDDLTAPFWTAANEDKLVMSGLTPGEYQVARYRMLRTKQMGFGRMIERTFLTIEPGQMFDRPV